MWLRKILRVLTVFGCALLLPAIARAAEFYVGEPVEQDNLQIVPNYLTGIQMDRMPKGMEMGPDTIHLEADVHAAKDEKHFRRGCVDSLSHYPLQARQRGGQV